MSFYYVLEIGLSMQYLLTRQDLHSGSRSGRAQERGLVAGREYIHLIWDNGGTFAPSLQNDYAPGRWTQQPKPWSGEESATVGIGMRDPPPSGQFKNGTYASSLHAFMPVVYGFALLGEVSKFVAVSSVRFSELQIDATALAVRVAGSIGETVEVSVAFNGAATQHNVTIPSAGFAVL